MKQITLLGTLFLLLTLSSACVPLSRELLTATLVPTLDLQPSETAVPAIATLTPTETAVPPTAIPSATAEPSQDSPTPPANQDPTARTHDATNVRHGPGLAYEVSHVLGAGTTMPILGRNQAGDWWAVPGPGDGPGPVGWVFDGVVAVQGNVNNLPILSAPPLTAVPIIDNSGPPPTDTCLANRPGQSPPPDIHLEPGRQFDLVARLGNWAKVLHTEAGWHLIVRDSGVIGWVDGADVELTGPCQPDDGPGSIPLIENPSSPPTNVCLAHRPGQFPPPDIHLGPGRQFALVARLGNWAEVLQTEVGWHLIVRGSGVIGWVDGEDVELTGPCPVPEPTPERIQFAPGETSITLDSNLEPPQREFYVFRAFAGQRVNLEMVSEFNRGGFALSGVDDGQPYKRLEDEQHIWSAVLPTTQDYLLTVAAPADAPTTGYRLTLTIEPLED